MNISLVQWMVVFGSLLISGQIQYKMIGRNLDVLGAAHSNIYSASADQSGLLPLILIHHSQHCHSRLQITRALPIDSPHPYMDALHHHAPVLIFPFWASTSAFGIAADHPFIIIIATNKPCPIGTKFWGNMGMICAMTTSYLLASAGRLIGGKMRNTPTDMSLSEN
jgi:hypothetical protein